MANYKLDYTGEQVNTAIGNALNGGGGGGTQLYMHNFYALEMDFEIYFSIYSSNSYKMGTSGFFDLFIGNVLDETRNIYINGSIRLISNDKWCTIFQIDFNRSISPIVDTITIHYIDENGEQMLILTSDKLNLIDNVTPL